MDNSIKLYSISELLEMHFYIPSYQRGYRWTGMQIRDLLDDIYGFTKKKYKEDKEFYCLQPIVVKAQKWERQFGDEQINVKGWEVVDGQQRLTTIRILITYLVKECLNGKLLKEAYGKAPFTIEYETREGTEHFLNNPIEGSDANIDYYYISAAYEEIEKWFDKQKYPRDAREAILKTLVFDSAEQKPEGTVQVIWYQMDDTKNPVDTFIRINLGKIPLTNSELIKALFLQERNFGEDFTELAKLRQLEIASEWDKIENTLQNEDIWWFLNKHENNKPSRIDFIFDLIYNIELAKNPNLEKELGNDSYSTFRFFYNKFQKSNYAFIKNEWGIITDYFYTFIEWFEDPVWYHYIGFLIYSDEKISDLFEITTRKDLTKDDITNELIKLIRSKFLKVTWVNDNQNKPFINLSYPRDNKVIRLMLLLYNIKHIVNQCTAQLTIYKFPFKAFKEERWDIEHIDSYTENPLNEPKTQLEWLQAAWIDLPEIKENPELVKRINAFYADNKQKDNFISIQLDIIEIAGESVKDPKTKNGIGNLTLLDQQTNCSYGNSLFPTKRKVVIEKDKTGKFIPICTKNVFFKYFDSSVVTNRWSEKDIILYRELIAETILDFLPQNQLQPVVTF